MAEVINTTIGDLAKAGHLEFGDGYRTKRSEHGKPGLPILRVAEVRNGRIEPEFADYVSDSYRHAMGSKISQPDDVVLTTKGTVGRVAIIPAESPQFVYSPQVCYFRTGTESPLRSRFLYYWFRSSYFWSQALSVKSQTDMADYINLWDIGSLRITLPPKLTQESVIQVLGALDDKIATNDATAVAAESLLRAHFSAAMQQSAREFRLGQLIELKYGKALKEEDRAHGQIPVFGGNGVSGWHDMPLEHGPGIIIGRKGANAGSVSWSPSAFWAIDTSFYVEPLSGRVPLEFLFFLLQGAGLRGLVGDSAIPGLNRDIALSATVMLPHDEEIDRFSETAQPLLALSAQLARESLALAELRDSLLPRLMSGDIRLRDAEKVVEDVT